MMTLKSVTIHNKLSHHLTCQYFILNSSNNIYFIIFTPETKRYPDNLLFILFTRKYLRFLLTFLIKTFVQGLYLSDCLFIFLFIHRISQCHPFKSTKTFCSSAGISIIVMVMLLLLWYLYHLTHRQTVRIEWTTEKSLMCCIMSHYHK